MAASNNAPPAPAATIQPAWAPGLQLGVGDAHAILHDEKGQAVLKKPTGHDSWDCRTT